MEAAIACVCAGVFSLGYAVIISWAVYGKKRQGLINPCDNCVYNPKRMVRDHVKR